MRRNRLSAGLLLVWVGMLYAGAAAQEVSVEELLARGDSAYTAADSKTALEFYSRVLEQDPDNYWALWKAARCYIDLGRMESKKDRKKQLFTVADSLARKTVQLYPDSAEAHFILSMAVGRMAEFAGGKKKIALSKEVKAEAEKAIELNPNHDGAYHVLGRWNYEIATLSWILKAAAKVIYGGVPPGASLEKAAEMFAKAIEIEPNKPVHYLEYGRTLIKLGRYAEAREALQKCLDTPNVYWDDDQTKEEARKLLKKIKGKS